MSTMSVKKVKWIHYIIVFALCFFFQYLPPIGQITPYGMGILGCFLGAIYGWTTIGIAWTSFMSFAGISVVVGVDAVVSAGFNSTVIAMIFVFLLMAVLDETGSITWLVNSILGSNFTKGKPWRTLMLLFLAVYVGGILNSMVMAVVFVGVFTKICKNLNISPFTKLPTFMMIGAAIALLMGQVGIPVMGNGLMLIATYNATFSNPLNFGKYMLFMIPIGLLTIGFFLVLMRFLFRVDVTPLKEYRAELIGGRQTITKDQKLAIGFFLIYMVFMVLSSLTILEPLTSYLAKLGMFGIISIVICVMMLVHNSEGKPILNYYSACGKIGWDPVLMVAFIMVISAFMNIEETGVSQTLATLLTPFTQLNPIVFVILALLFAVLLTNVMTNLIVVVIVMPVLYNYSLIAGLNPTMLIIMLFLFSHLAICTPAAAPATGICMSATEIIKASDMMKYACICLPLLFIFDLIVGLALAQLIF